MFCPDGTRGVVRGLDVLDLKTCGIQGVIVNTLHLMLSPGDAQISRLGGIKKFMSYDGTVISDSGGFQVFSMITRKQVWGRITEEGLLFEAVADGAKKRYLLTPEKSIEVQFNLGSDMMVVLDYFTPPQGSLYEQTRSVTWTTQWAHRSKAEFERQLKVRKIKEADRPALLGVIQGGFDKKMRAKSARELIDIGFDGYGFGGWPINAQGKFDYGIFKYVAGLMPQASIKFALGVGKPWDIVQGVKFGYHIFDCVIPTRDGRHGRLFVFRKELNRSSMKLNRGDLDEIFITKSKYARDLNPISKFCTCLTCKTYSRAYLHHLFKIKDTLAYRLATIHNLTHYSTLLKHLR